MDSILFDELAKLNAETVPTVFETDTLKNIFAWAIQNKIPGNMGELTSKYWAEQLS